MILEKDVHMSCLDWWCFLKWSIIILIYSPNKNPKFAGKILSSKQNWWRRKWWKGQKWREDVWRVSGLFEESLKAWNETDVTFGKHLFCFLTSVTTNHAWGLGVSHASPTPTPTPISSFLTSLYPNPPTILETPSPIHPYTLFLFKKPHLIHFNSLPFPRSFFPYFKIQINIHRYPIQFTHSSINPLDLERILVN